MESTDTATDSVTSIPSRGPSSEFSLVTQQSDAGDPIVNNGECDIGVCAGKVGGMATSHVAIVDVDPRYIVNEYCLRPVLASDKETVRRGFLKTGYLSSNLLSCRYATAPEMESFYMRAPYKYSNEKASEVTRSQMRREDSGGHFIATTDTSESLWCLT